VEKELVRHIPEDLIPKAHHWLILHGRYICVARQPKCTICPLSGWCKYYAEVVTKDQKPEAQTALPASPPNK
jgi:endonuclease-3